MFNEKQTFENSSASWVKNEDLLETSLDENNPGHCKQCKDEKLLKIYLKMHVKLFMKKLWSLLLKI